MIAEVKELKDTMSQKRKEVSELPTFAVWASSSNMTEGWNSFFSLAPLLWSAIFLNLLSDDFIFGKW